MKKYIFRIFKKINSQTCTPISKTHSLEKILGNIYVLNVLIHLVYSAQQHGCRRGSQEYSARPRPLPSLENRGKLFHHTGAFSPYMWGPFFSW